MIEYLNLCNKILKLGEYSNDRTNTGTIRLFGCRMEFNLKKGFPIVTTKKIHFKSILIELLWFIAGETNIKFLEDNGVSIWNEWADSKGDLGPIYGHQWRKWTNNVGGAIDQLNKTINELKNNKCSRRLIVSSWNVGDLDRMALPPCHLLFQFYVNNNDELSCQLYQRSADMFLGAPFNISSYSLLMMMIAKVCRLNLGKFIHVIGDAHIYTNHIEQVKLQLKRKPYKLPIMVIKRNHKSIDDFTMDDFELKNYQHHPRIVGKVSI